VYLHPCVLVSPMVVSRGPRTQVRCVAPPWLGPPIIYCLDCDLLGEGHQIAFIRDFIELHSMGEGPRDHEILHHGTVPKLVLDGVRVVGEGLLEELLKVVCRRSCLALANACGSHDAPHAGAACYLIVAAFVVGRDYYPLRTLLAPLLAALGILDDDVRWHLLAAAWGRLPTAWGRAKFGHLIAGGILGGDAVQLLGGVPKSVVVLCHIPKFLFQNVNHFSSINLIFSKVFHLIQVKMILFCI
jgi:hypothetical protein